MLSLGKKFALPYDRKDLPLLQIIADGEFCLQTISDERNRDIARAKLCNLISSHSHSFKWNREMRLILKLYVDTIKFLTKQRNNIIITTADKGNVTVAMWKKDYLNKMQQLLEDGSTYRRLRSDPTRNVQTKNNDYVKYLRENNFISDREKFQLLIHKATPPKMYGLPKVHKTACPIRPIVASMNSPTYKLSRYLTSILKNLTKDSQYNVSNSISFKKMIESQTIEDNEIMVSFDVISLFTNVPTNTVLKIIENKWNLIANHTNIPMRKFVEMVRFCITDGNYFVFNQCIYRQTFGLPMGNPLSPILADIVMEELLINSIERMSHKPVVVFKYVDDLFSILPREHLMNILGTFNDYHRNIQFTVEEENGGELPFLDVKVVRNGNNIVTDWYKKPTSSSRLLHYKSSHPKYQILNTAKGFIRRVLDLSNRKFQAHNIWEIRETLHQNGYPKTVINRLLSQHMAHRELETEQETVMRSSNPFSYRSATYIPGLSERFKRIFFSQDNQTKISFKTGKTIKKCFSRLKDGTPKELCSDLIYRIACKGNNEETCSSTYIGTTGQYLKNRISNHRSDLRGDNPNKTALAAHCRMLNHDPNFDDTVILHKEMNYSKRMTLEALYIQTTPNTMNRKTDTDNISSTYCALLDRQGHGILSHC